MKYLKAVLAAALLSCSMLAQADFDPAAQLPVSPQVRVGKLPNGLTYYIQRNPKPQQRVELRLAVKAGSILEDEDQLGLAHFTEHMAFNGSTHFKRHELVSWLQSIGVKFGADLNAYTGVDETVYMLPIPVDRKENLDKGLLVLEDWAGGVQFNDDDVESERNIVLEEWRLGRGAADRMNKVLLPKLFNGSRYAERLPIGKPEVLRTFKPAAIKRFYKDWYRPDLMAVFVVGDIDPAEAEKLVISHFSNLKNPENPRPRAVCRDPGAHHVRSAGDHGPRSDHQCAAYPLPDPAQAGGRHLRRIPRTLAGEPGRPDAQPAHFRADAAGQSSLHPGHLDDGPRGARLSLLQFRGPAGTRRSGPGHQCAGAGR
ncbi:M16 family metallopeptidase [Pseudoduganella sp. UC29_106]|uniref:M16 family metallopeptidase n=1 Tax=Pseudoduganella sp. UC29_106 TaxID=3374553 RepID=UPI003757FFF2